MASGLHGNFIKAMAHRIDHRDGCHATVGVNVESQQDGSLEASLTRCNRIGRSLEVLELRRSHRRHLGTGRGWAFDLTLLSGPSGDKTK